MKVSIITVCFNAEKTIEETIISVINQTYKNIEYIIIDGASNDATLDIVNKYKEKINLVITEKDNGIYDAMNKGIKQASGDVIGMINADDIYMPRAVEYAVSYMSGKNLDFYFGSSFFREGLVSGYKPEKLFLGLDYIGTAHSGGFFVKTIIHDRYGMYDLKFKTSSDYDFFLRIILNGCKGGSGKDYEISNIFRPGGFSSERSYFDKKKEEYLIRKNNNQSYLEIYKFLIVSIVLQLGSKFVKLIKKILFGWMKV